MKKVSYDLVRGWGCGEGESSMHTVFFGSGITKCSYGSVFESFSYHFKSMDSVFSNVEIPIAAVLL